MLKAKDEPATLKDVKKVIYEAMDYMVSKTQKLLRSELEGEMTTKLDKIHEEIIKLKYEIRTNNELYSFWAERHLSPELREEFLRFQDKLQKKTLKRVD